MASLAIVGAPLSSSAVGKYAAKTAVEGVVLAGIDLVSVLPWVATGSTVLLIRYAVLLRGLEREPAGGVLDRELWAWLALVAVCIPVPWIIGERWVPLTAVPELEAVTLWDATWPVLVGLGLAAVARPLRRLLSRVPAVPPGDLVVGYSAVVRGAGAVDVARRALGPRRLVAPVDEDAPVRLPPAAGGLFAAACFNLMPGSLIHRLGDETVGIHSLAPDVEAAAGWDELQTRLGEITE